ncbi:MAG: TIGR03915 family putative DNA repair protein, partial [Pseudomonadota bacterium]
MVAMQNVSLGAHYVVHLPEPDDFAFWRERARGLIQCDVPPDRVSWVEPGGTGDLFAQEGPSRGDRRLPVPDEDARQVRASKRFMQLARNAALHSDSERFSLLYRLLWRLQSNSRCMEDKADPDVRRVEELDKSVRRDSHKMHAFVRFREVRDDSGAEHYVAWFEPDHHIV